MNYFLTFAKNWREKKPDKGNKRKIVSNFVDIR